MPWKEQNRCCSALFTAQVELGLREHLHSKREMLHGGELLSQAVNRTGWKTRIPVCKKI